MRYYVTHRVEARHVVGVDADNVDDAIKKANDAFSEADFGAATDIDGEAIIVEDEDGNYVWEK